jgi:hypothetical protein
VSRKSGLALVAVVVLAVVAAVLFLVGIPRELGGDDAYEHREEITDPLASDHWHPARSGDQGVTVWDPLNALRGFTLYGSGEGAKATLITMIGQEVHAWSLPYSKVWTQDRAAVQEPQPDSLVLFRWLHMYPDGGLLASYEAAGHSPAGYGLVRMDKDSQPIWTYLERVRGTFDVGPDGRIYAIVQHFRDNAEGRRILDDQLAVLSPDGRELARISLTDAIARAGEEDVLGSPDGAPLNVASADLIETEDAEGPGKPGQVLLSFPHAGALAILDPASAEIVWAERGPAAGQQDADMLPDGNVLILVDEAAPDGTAASQVIEARADGLAPGWTYSAGEGQPPLHTTARGSVQRLENGNTLITESDAGRLVEVDPEGTIVWDYKSPQRAGPDNGLVPVVTSGQRIPASYLDREFRGYRRP